MASLVLDDTTTKRMAYVENILKSTTTELEQAQGYLRRLEMHNAKIKVEMEACKLSASKSDIVSLQVAKRETKALKRIQSLEKELAKLQSEISKEKDKTSKLEEVLAKIKQSREEAETKLKEESKAINEARAVVVMEQLLKESTEAKVNKKMKELGMEMEINLQRYKDDVHRLKQEISSAKATARVVKQQQESIIPPSPSEPEEEVNGGRKCILCKTNEVSVLLLPCTHQVMCATCSDLFQFKPRVCCPICLTVIQQSIHVFKGSSY